MVHAWMIWLVLAGLLVVIALQLLQWLRPRGSAGVDAGLAQQLQALQQAAQQTQLALAKNDGAMDHMAQQLLALSHHLNQHQQAASDSLRKLVDGRMAQSLAEARASRQEMQQHFQQLQEALSQQLHRLQQGSLHTAEQLRGTLNERLAAIQTDNADKLEAMRRTVDEKLHETLEQRLGESFKLVSDRLEQVHKGLGEMQTLAGSVGDLKRVMTNVKTRGTWGEVQLGAIIDNVLTPAQYAKNVKTVPGSDELVEFAIRLPGQGGDPDAPVWLPIDAKYPVEHYQRLQDALDNAERVAIAAAGNAFENSIRAEAKKIAAKYVSPPFTTDFAVMYLPMEGLFAEVLRRPGLVESLQNEHRVVVTGPANLAAMLNSLQMGFKTLAIEQRSSEVWVVLGQVKTEFTKFGEVVEATRKSIDAAARRFEQVDVRTRAIQRRLRGVQELPGPQEAADDVAGPELLPGKPLPLHGMGAQDEEVSE